MNNYNSTRQDYTFQKAKVLLALEKKQKKSTLWLFNWTIALKEWWLGPLNKCTIGTSALWKIENVSVRPNVKEFWQKSCKQQVYGRITAMASRINEESACNSKVHLTMNIKKVKITQKT